MNIFVNITWCNVLSFFLVCCTICQINLCELTSHILWTCSFDCLRLSKTKFYPALKTNVIAITKLKTINYVLRVSGTTLAKCTQHITYLRKTFMYHKFILCIKSKTCIFLLCLKVFRAYVYIYSTALSVLLDCALYNLVTSCVTMFILMSHRFPVTNKYLSINIYKIIKKDCTINRFSNKRSPVVHIVEVVHVSDVVHNAILSHIPIR